MMIMTVIGMRMRTGIRIGIMVMTMILIIVIIVTVTIITIFAVRMIFARKAIVFVIVKNNYKYNFQKNHTDSNTKIIIPTGKKRKEKKGEKVR